MAVFRIPYFSTPRTVRHGVISGSVGLNQTAIALTSSIGTHTLTLGAIALTATAISLGSSIGMQSISSAKMLTATPISLTSSLGLHGITLGTRALTATPIQLTSSIGTQSLTNGARNLTATAIQLTTSIGTHSLSMPRVLRPTPIDLVNTIGTHRLETNTFQFQFHVGGPGFAVDDLLIARRTDYDFMRAKNVVYEVHARVLKVSREGEATVAVFKGKEYLSRFKKSIDFTRYGNVSNQARQGSVAIISDDAATNEFDKPGSAPCIDIRDGVNSVAMAHDISTLKGRFGRLDGITDPDFGAYQPNGYGVFTQNFYGKGTFVLGTGSKGFWMLADAPRSLSDLDGAAAAQLNQLGIDIGNIAIPTWDDLKPEFFDTVHAQSGIYINTDSLGYYNHASTLKPYEGWTTYMDSNGDFYLRGTVTGDGFFIWDASNELLYLNDATLQIVKNPGGSSLFDTSVQGTGFNSGIIETNGDEWNAYLAAEGGLVMRHKPSGGSWLTDASLSPKVTSQGVNATGVWDFSGATKKLNNVNGNFQLLKNGGGFATLTVTDGVVTALS